MKLEIIMSAFEGKDATRQMRSPTMEFHICNEVRNECALESELFSLTGNVVFADFPQTRAFAQKLNERGYEIKDGQLNAMGFIDEALHYMTRLYREQVQPDIFETALARLNETLGEEQTNELLRKFCERFPPKKVYTKETDIEDYLQTSEAGVNHSLMLLEEILLLALANINPAFKPFLFMFDDKPLSMETKSVYDSAVKELEKHLKALPVFGSDRQNLWDILRAPALASPDSLSGQLDFMRRQWGVLLKKFMRRLLVGMDIIKEEEKPSWGDASGHTEIISFGHRDDEYEKFSQDQDWMPRTVLIAKSTLVWLYQLSKKYNQEITRLDQIPNEELDELSRRGFTGLWLIGLWERSAASKTIKQWTGNPDAAASAYSLYDYDIASELGGWDALGNLRDRCRQRGLRLGADMVPNHTGVDSRWVMEYPDRFLQLDHPPFPSYSYNCGNLSGREDITVQIEEHYFTRSDAAVVFKHVDNRTGITRFIYHGNDGTSMPWNDTAQIDFLNPEAREAVIRAVIKVCQQFPIVRFDAAMTLAKRHIQRLWYPEPGRGGDIASRSEYGSMTNEEFDRRIPNEFWREVVDRAAVEAPNTLLLAEAFWMMEGYFVRTLGMHRVYNSAFMNMLKKEENNKYRASIKNTLEFDPEVLKRFVNFMNNPDEETAVAQFGKDDKYFGICTLMVTMPGLPMFGHGQIEGFEEKYGMEYRRSYRDEKTDQWLVDRHEHEIFPLMKRRMLFSGSENFCLFDLYAEDGSVNENVFAYSNRFGNERSLVFYNNSYYEASGWIHTSCANIPLKDGGTKRDTLGQALALEGDFALFYEQRSGLWFVRSVKELYERGFFVKLKGYEAQVYLDVHTVHDADGKWSCICNELNGGGVRDLEAAFQDTFLAELYKPFTAIFSGERLKNLVDAFSRSKLAIIAEAAAEIAEQYIDSLEEPILSFIIQAKRYLVGADGRYKPFKTASYYPHKITEPSTVWEEFAGYLRRLFKLSEDMAAVEDLPFVLGYGVFSALRTLLVDGSGADAVALVGHWRLDRKMRDAFSQAGVGGDTSRVIALMKAVLARTSVDSIPDGLTQIFMENYHSDDFRQILGINVFNGVVWFNKEAFGATITYAPLFLSLESDVAFKPKLVTLKKTARQPSAKSTKPSKTKWEKRVKAIAQAVKRLRAAEEKSDYQFEKLLAELE
ncbi:MAG: alpha-amylase [Treponema sp.]|jgi:glycosidase|nr:alpha-amylase [Treponema sp.]